MSVKGYIAPGSSLDETAEGITETQVWDIAVTSNGIDFLWSAREDGRVPKVGDRHPKNAALIVVGRNIVDMGGGEARITLNYEPSDGGVSQAIGSILDVRYDGTVVIQEKKTDIRGEPLISGLTAYTVGVPTPQALIEVDRVESQTPGAIVRTYMGKVNRSPINGYAARTLMMQAPRGRKDPSTGNFIITYVFSYRPEKWDSLIEEVQIETVDYQTEGGAFSPGSTQTAIKSVNRTGHFFRVVHEIDFSGLALIF